MIKAGACLIGVPYYSGKKYCFSDFLKSLEVQDFDCIEPYFIFLEAEPNVDVLNIFDLLEMRQLIREFKEKTGYHVELTVIPEQMLYSPKTHRQKRYINTFCRDVLRNYNFEETYKHCDLQLMIDPDILMPKNGFKEMFECLKLGADLSTILLQMHFFKQETYIIHRQTRYFEFRNYRKGEIDAFKELNVSTIEVDNATTALMLVTKEVFKQVPEIRFIEGLIWGHDVIFSQDARVRGFKIMCSLEAEALHLQPEATYAKMKDANLIELWLS